MSRRSPPPALAALIGWGLLATPASACLPGDPATTAIDTVPGLDVTIIEERYPVRASTLAEVIERMDANPLEGLPPGTAHGLTSFRFEPGWTLEAGGDGCAFSSVTATLDITIHLPEWDGYDDATETERAAWDEYLDALTAHEYAHRDITVEGVSALMGELREMQGTGCNALQRSRRRLIQRRMDEIQERHDALDEGFR